MAYRLIGSKQLPEPELIYCQLDALEKKLSKYSFRFGLGLSIIYPPSHERDHMWNADHRYVNVCAILII